MCLCIYTALSLYRSTRSNIPLPLLLLPRMYACVPLGWQRVCVYCDVCIHTPNKKWAKEYLKVQFVSTTVTVAGTMKLLSHYAVLLKLTHKHVVVACARAAVCVCVYDLASVLKIDCLNIQTVLFKTQFSHKFWPPAYPFFCFFCYVLCCRSFPALENWNCQLLASCHVESYWIRQCALQCNTKNDTNNVTAAADIFNTSHHVFGFDAFFLFCLKTKWKYFKTGTFFKRGEISKF